MTIQTFYPIFEHGQVLTSSQLNTMVDYLEQQDRLSRRTLSGIGIVCGFEVDLSGRDVEISGGVAVTSEGYLITSETHRFDRVRPYVLPIPTAQEATPDEIDAARYPFLFDESGNQIPVQELIDTDFVAAPGEADPGNLTPADLNNAVVMLFLEDERAALKSCDVNDCSDKGAERRFALRRLLLTREQAEVIVKKETQIAGHPIDLGRHPRLELPYLRVEKLALAREGVKSFGGLMQRILTIAQKLGGELPGALRAAYQSYDYLLQDMYAPGEDVFPDSYFDNVWGQLTANPFLAQYFYDYMRDVAMAYNEFSLAAAGFEAQCMPNPDRFPRHVLLGDVAEKPDAFARAFPNDAAVLAHDQLNASTGAGLPSRPALRRTHFTPSPAHDGHQLEEVRALFMRMHLLAMTFRLNGLMSAPIRITPSRDGGAPLTERAIPFHYDFDTTKDIFRNWSPRKTRANLLNTVYSYRLNPPDAAHPLFFRVDDQDFYRIEGVVGKPLGTAMAELIAWKHELGLSFGIEPVYMRLSTGQNDQVGDNFDLVALANLLGILRKLLLCRMSDFDALLLVLLKTLFAFLVFIVRGIAAAFATVNQQNTGLTLQPTGDAPTGLSLNLGRDASGLLINEIGARRLSEARLATFLPPKEQDQLKRDAAAIQKQLVGRTLVRGDALKLAVPDVAPESIGAVYEKVRDDDAGGNLFDRTKALVAQNGGGDEETQAVYAQVAMLDQGDQLMRVLNVERLADFDEGAFDTAYRGFAGAYQNYVQVASVLPDKTGTAEQTQQIVAAAETVASDNTAFALGNLQSEITTVLQRVLSGLTLDGFAAKHPGLEHSAGVPKGGTFVLAYVARRELAQHLGQIGTSFRDQGIAVARILGNDTAFDLQAALRDLEKSVAAASDDPLDQYVVLADFCLPYKCCDSDCSDMEISRQIVADPFGKATVPGPMAVPPLAAQSRQAGGVAAVNPNLGDLRGDPPVVVVNRPIGRVVSTDLRGFERPPNMNEILNNLRRGNTEPVAPARIANGVVFGRVLSRTTRNQDVPVGGATVAFSHADGSEGRTTAERDGTFKIEVPAGEFKMRASAPRHFGRNRSFTVDPGQELEVTLRLSQR